MTADEGIGREKRDVHTSPDRQKYFQPDSGARLWLLFGSLIVAFALAEIGLRGLMPQLGSDPSGPTRPHQTSPFTYNDRIGFELKPFALIESGFENGTANLEQLNSEGFRGPEYTLPKSQGIFRIVAVGDSVTQSLSVSYSRSWEQVLERMLNHYAAERNMPRRFEVINAGIGGYVSWQVLSRLKDRVLKYQPDLVLVLVGWNDLIFSSLASWTPRTDLSKLEQAYGEMPPQQRKENSGWLLRELLRYSYVARLARQARSSLWNARRIRHLISQRQQASGVAFNEKALRTHLENLKRVYEATTASGARMGLILWPALLTPDQLDDADLHRHLLVIYSNFPLSTRELWSWYEKYLEAQRHFAAQRLDILLIDAASAFADRDKKARLQLFSDLAHLTVDGNRMLAEVLAQQFVEHDVAGWGLEWQETQFSRIPDVNHSTH